MNPSGLLLVAIGAFVACAAGFDWDFFMNNYKARGVVWLFGRNGARIFYGLIGVGFIVGGLLVAVGLLGTD